MLVFDETKKFLSKGRLSLFGKTKNLSSEDVARAREYIEKFWPKLVRSHPKNDESLLGLPKPYLVPAYEHGHEFDFNELYYWDSYFMIQALLDEKHRDLVVGILEDLTTLFKQYKIIPNASRTYLTGRSQPPFLTSFIFDVFQTYKLSQKWLNNNLDIAKEEYQTVWMGTTKPNGRQIYRGLSRYYDINYINDLAEAESGWDMTPRFNRKALDYLPVDLNALLYRYESDFARGARLDGHTREAVRWEHAAKLRAITMKELMWDESRGMFYDYNFVKKKPSNVSSLASFYPMWAGMVSDAQAKRMVNALRRFEQKGGLSVTDSIPLGQFVVGSVPMQWAYPNGWAPLHLIVVRGLQRYGYHEDAARVATKWMRTNLSWFNKHGVFLEKYNVVAPDKPPIKGLYPSQTGFGWTNSVFEVFAQEFIDRAGSAIIGQ